MGEEETPLGRWLGARKGWGRERKEGSQMGGVLIVLMGGVRKARQKRGT